MKDQAIAKLRAEMKEHKNTGYVQAVGTMLLKHLEACPASAEKIMAEGKTIKGSLKAMRDEAQKQKDGNCAVLSDDEGFAVVLGYYGIEAVAAKEPEYIRRLEPVSVADFDINLDDLL